MTGDELIQEAQRYLMNTYARQPLVAHKGRGCRVYDLEGHEYLDFMGGVAVNILGHCHPRVTVALQKQAQRLVHCSNLYYNEPQAQLAKLLVRNSFADKAFFCNSGAEANEAAIKLIRLYAQKKHGANRFEILTMENSFHGRTMATLTATGQPKMQQGFEPLTPGFRTIPFNDLGAVRKAITQNTAAILIEPIQGEGGVWIAEKEYLQGLRKLCHEHGLLLALDEVQTGMGRTGKLFAYEHYGIEPDLMTLAKGLGAGFPIGAMLAKEEFAQAFTPGSHGSTFGGNPLACAAGVATLETLLEDGFILDHCREMGEYLLQQLRALQPRHRIIKDIRGKGLLVGMELTLEGQPIVQACLDERCLINCTAGRVLRFMPPLTVTREEIDQMIGVLDKALSLFDVPASP